MFTEDQFVHRPITTAQSASSRDAVLRLPTPLGAPAPAFSRRLIHLDVLRCIAILLVMGQHTPFRMEEHSVARGFFEVWRYCGWVGVDLFFALSGFLIGGLLIAEHYRTGTIRFGRFIVRRTFKIWPTYLAFLGCALAFDLFRVQPRIIPLSTRLAQSWKAIWPYLVHLQNYRETRMIETIGHGWSLAVEEHFYLLLPLLLLGLGRRQQGAHHLSRAEPLRWIPAIGLTLLAVCLAIRVNNWRGNPRFDNFLHQWPTHLRIDALFAGVVLAYAVHFARPWVDSLRRWRWLILAVGIACFVPFFWISGISRFCCTIGYTMLSLGSVAFVLSAWFSSVPASGQSPGPIWLPRQTPALIVRGLHRVMCGMAWVGARSYSIYLFHLPFSQPIVIKLRAHIGLWTSPWHYALITAVYLACGIGLGSMMYWMIEGPAVALRDKLFPARDASRPKGPRPVELPLRAAG